MTSVVHRTPSTSVRGKGGAGPLRARCEVLAYRQLGRYHSLTFVAPEVADRSRPGQFVSLAVEARETTLRRPFSIYSVSQHGPWAGTVEIVFDDVGPGTRWLTTRSKHDVVDLVGPLGKPFPMPARTVPCLLVGGGYGAAPLLYLAHELQQAGQRVDMTLGAATVDRVFNPIEAKRLSASTQFTTEDGSLGTRGVVTDVMPKMIEQAGTGVVYACGPMAMLAAVARLSADLGVPCQVAVEEEMACGTGVCFTCVLPYRRRDGIVNLRACVDGPVFNGAKVAWEAVGTRAMGDLAWTPGGANGVAPDAGVEPPP